MDSEIERKIKEVLKQEIGSGLFTARKITDLPTDALSVVNRKYVNLNGTTANRPPSSVIGQHYFDTTINKPIWADGNNWRDATSSIVG